MPDPHRPRHGVRNALVFAAIALFVARLGLHAFARVLDLVWIAVVVLAVVAIAGSRSSRR
jgi:hypothetical protein